MKPRDGTQLWMQNAGSRVISQFKRDRFIRLESLNRIRILDHAGLREIADGALEL